VADASAPDVQASEGPANTPAAGSPTAAGGLGRRLLNRQDGAAGNGAEEASDGVGRSAASGDATGLAG